VADAFLQTLQLAKELGILKVGTVSVDGTKIKANASIHKNVRYDRARELEEQLTLEIQELLNKAQKADQKQEGSQEALHAELERLEELSKRMRLAQQKLEERALERVGQERKTQQNKIDRGGGGHGQGRRKDRIPKDKPEDSELINLSDPESRIMKKSRTSEFVQAFNAQLVVDAEGSMLVLGHRVTNIANDGMELTADVHSIPAQIGFPKTVLADKGFASENPVGELQSQGIEVLVSISNEDTHNQRKHDWRPSKKANHPGAIRPGKNG
jgi:hypothetical protein